MKHNRNYQEIVAAAGLAVKDIESAEQKMEVVTDILWEGMKDQGLAWVGFYKVTDNRKEMLLVCRQPKPACSPIGLHGVCGRAWKERKAQVVPDVHALGGDHIVCDPSNLSEVVVPVIDQDGECLYVLDLDSGELDSFGQEDVEGLELVLKRAGL
jgi:putative methionine-R-sulfoxide reductase with GAF domain